MVDLPDRDLVAIRNSQYQPIKRKLMAEAEQFRRECEIADVKASIFADTGLFQKSEPS